MALFFLNPAVTALVAWAVLKEPLGLLGAAGVGVSVLGLLVLSQPPFLFDAGGTVSAGEIGGLRHLHGCALHVNRAPHGARHGRARLPRKAPLRTCALFTCAGARHQDVMCAPPARAPPRRPQSWDHQRVVGTMFGVISALCAAGAFVCIRVIGKSEPALVMSVYFHTCAFISSSIPLAAGIPDK